MDHTMACYVFHGQYYQGDIMSLVDHVTDGMLPVSGTVLPGRQCRWWTISLMDHTVACDMFQGQYYHGDTVSLADYTMACYLFQGQYYQEGDIV